MSLKVDTLLKKAITFERLSLYSDRKVYLAALAQADLPDIRALIDAVDTTRMNTVQKIGQFWRQNRDLPPAAIDAYYVLARPQADLATAQGVQLGSTMYQFVTALTDIYRALTASGQQKFLQFAQQTVFPALEEMQQKVDQFKKAIESTPLPTGDGSLGEDTIPQAPEQTQTDVGYPSIPREMQSSLNKLLNLHIKVDGKLGPETRGAIDKFKEQYNMPSDATDQEVINLIKYTVQRQ